MINEASASGEDLKACFARSAGDVSPTDTSLLVCTVKMFQQSRAVFARFVAMWTSMLAFVGNDRVRGVKTSRNESFVD